MKPASPFFILVLGVLIRATLCDVNPNFQACEPKTCGNGPIITYPFYIQDKQDPSCGLPFYGLVCASNGFPLLNLSKTFYIVNEIFYHNQSLRVSNPSFPIFNSPDCLSPSNNLTLDYWYTLAPNQKEVRLFFDCELPSLPEEIKENVCGCYEGNRTKSVLGMTVDDEAKKLKYANDNCGSRLMTTVVENLEGGIREALVRGFLLKPRNWTASECDRCQSSGGRCGFVHTHEFGFRCFCRDRIHLVRCHSDSYLFSQGETYEAVKTRRPITSPFAHEAGMSEPPDHSQVKPPATISMLPNRHSSLSFPTHLSSSSSSYLPLFFSLKTPNSQMNPGTPFFILVLWVLIRATLCDVNPNFQACEPKTCGNGPIITYPFYILDKQDPSCVFPLFDLVCDSDGFPLLNLSNTLYIVHEIFYVNQSLRVSNPNFPTSNSPNCLSPFNNLTLDYRYTLAPNQKEVRLFFDCELPSLPEETKENVWGCYEGNQTKSVLGMAVDDKAKKLKYANDNCGGGLMTTVVENLEGGIREALARGLLLKPSNWTASECEKCQSSGGRCGFLQNDGFGFRCFCRDCDDHVRCSPGEGKLAVIVGPGKLAVIVGPVSAVATIGIFVIIIYWFRRMSFWKNKSKAHQDFEVFLKSHGSLAAKRYSYSEIKRMTNCFKEKLGQGGFGSVFKGKLHDKCPVAVKVLKETKGNGEEFINEVASISKTAHVNIVTLLGFCFEGSKKVLVYEFMANGSLEKFIFENEGNLIEGNIRLSCKTLHQIAVGVARGLEYLHRGCNTRILHFDIKPHNILLDENFCPKISDFGLAKICLTNESVVSMMCARGTIGYIAPEVISRSFGVVSQKSDVYSFGMMIFEMVGGRRNVNVNVANSSEIYFPHWIYKRLELNEDFGLRSIRNEGDKERIRQMVITSLWCIQTNPSKRPMMSKVVEMLEGRVETLQVPPKPYLASPSTSPSRPSSSSTP